MDLAAVLIDYGEVSGFRFADGAVARSRTAVWHRAAELDLSIGDAGSVLAGGKSEATGENEPAADSPDRSSVSLS